jgi:hypothetical protein
MKSGKQRRIELKAKKQARETKLVNQQREAREAKREAEKLAKSEWAASHGRVIVDLTSLAPNNSYDDRDFVECGYYLDRPFTCAGCKSQEIWTAVQQKWWYEVAKGGLYYRQVLSDLSPRKAISPRFIPPDSSRKHCQKA